MGLEMNAYQDMIRDRRDDLKGFLDRASGTIAVFSHTDADGLCAAEIVKRYLRRSSLPHRHLFPRRGEIAFGASTSRRLAGLDPDRICVVDLGVTDREMVRDKPAFFIDHHRPMGRPPRAGVLSSYGSDPALPTALLAYRSLGDAVGSSASWLAAVGTAADLGPGYVFEGGDLDTTGLRKTWVSEADILLNSAARSASYDIETPIRLLERASGIEDLTDPGSPEVSRLGHYRKEVNDEVARCRHEPPNFSWRVAVIAFSSRCRISGLIAETWRRSLKNYFVIAANFGYIEGKVHYAIRTELAASVIDLLESVKPPDRSDPVVQGHDHAAGGMLDLELWMTLADRLGFRPKR
jgi:single-stranded-DNA-specific exonuclease